ncbi:hypothetical protein BpHYR1_020896 [Brachionus plicatilis]|uniref:Uncharacterized protein n=1 Tax=Brachionus plicatilis TaxID=10195 RepID=A0A3M7RWH9_BRAPC|nr:hypothetical protein BpHYR1_020896 [Brachionus plicatilis]
MTNANFTPFLLKKNNINMKVMISILRPLLLHFSFDTNVKIKVNEKNSYNFVIEKSSIRLLNSILSLKNPIASFFEALGTRRKT